MKKTVMWAWIWFRVQDRRKTLGFCIKSRLEMKKLLTCFMFVFFIVLQFSSCGNNKKNEMIKIEPKFNVDINIKDGNDLIFTIKSNLPDETKIMLGVCDIDTGVFLRQDSGETINGTVMIGPFHNMDEGKYILDITVPLISMQKQSVKNILGNNGENLIGNLVKDEMNSKIIEARVTFEIPEFKK